MTLFLSIGGLMGLGLAIWGLWRWARAYRRFRGTRVLPCPENGEAARVDLAVWRIALRGSYRRPALRVRDCSRWRARAPCEGACLSRIEAAPEDCVVTTILADWYRGKTCVCCGRSVDEITGWRRPCLMSPDLRLVEWEEIQAEKIPQVLATHAPVCRTCLVAETHTV